MLSFRILAILAAAAFVSAFPARRRQEGGGSVPTSLQATAPVPTGSSSGTFPTGASPTGTFPTAPFPTGGTAFPTSTGFPHHGPHHGPSIAVQERDYNWYPAEPLPARA